MIIDTSAIIDLLNDDKLVNEKIKEINIRNESILTTSVSVFEIWQGTRDIEDEDKKYKIDQLFESMNILNLNIDSAKIAGRIHALLRKEGKIIEPEDSMIGGIVKFHNEVILTRNVKHFDRIKDIRLETY